MSDDCMGSGEGGNCSRRSKPRVAVVALSDYVSFPMGGTLSSIRAFLKFSGGSSFEIWLVGATTDKNETLGKVTWRKVGDTVYPFIPLFFLDAPGLTDRRPFIPLRIRACLAYIIRRRCIREHDFDLLYVHNPEGFPLFLRRRYQILYHVHGRLDMNAPYTRYRIFRAWPLNWVFMHWTSRLLRGAERLISVDEESMAFYCGMSPGLSARFDLVPSAVDTDFFRVLPNPGACRAKWGIPPEGPVVALVGRLSEIKRVHLVVEAFRHIRDQLPCAVLLIAGEGEERDALEEQVARSGLSESVRFLGALDWSKMPEVYNAANVCVVASIRESQCMVILESLACGVPVVSTRVGVAPHVIRDGETGFLLDDADPEEIARRILDVLTRCGTWQEACVRAAHVYASTSKRISDIIEGMLCEMQGVEHRGGVSPQSPGPESEPQPGTRSGRIT